MQFQNKFYFFLSFETSIYYLIKLNLETVETPGLSSWDGVVNMC